MRWSLTLVVMTAVLLAACASGMGPEDESQPDLGTWTSVAPAPEARTEHNVTTHDGLVYVAGGFVSVNELTATFHIYDPEADSWREGAPIPAARHHAALVGFGGAIYLIGGYTGTAFRSWEPQSTVFVYDIATDSWDEGPSLPAPRGAHAAAVTSEGVIHVMGGVGEDGMGNLPDDHFVYDTTADSWETAAPLPTPREHTGAAYDDGFIYVAAGRVMGDSAMGTFEAYNVAAGEWEPLPDVPTGRSGIAVTVLDSQVYVFGGEAFEGTARTFNEAERYDPRTRRWEALSPMLTARHGLGAGVVDGAIYVVGGGPGAGLTFSDVNERWTP